MVRAPLGAITRHTGPHHVAFAHFASCCVPLGAITRHTGPHHVAFAHFASCCVPCSVSLPVGVRVGRIPGGTSMHTMDVEVSVCTARKGGGS